MIRGVQDFEHGAAILAGDERLFLFPDTFDEVFELLGIALVERFFNRIKHFRGIATRYDKCSENYLAAVKLICARIWCAA